MAIRLDPGTCLSQHRDGYVSVSCGACPHQRELPAEELAHIIGWDTRIVPVLPRLRCSACGAREARVTIFYRHRPRGWNKNPS